MNKPLLTLTVAAVAVAALFANEHKMRQSQTAGVSDCKSCCIGKRKPIGKDAAIAIALAHAGLKRDAVRDLKCELDREDGIMVYEVEFESGAYDYEYDIDAKTGKILKSKKELD